MRLALFMAPSLVLEATCPARFSVSLSSTSSLLPSILVNTRLTAIFNSGAGPHALLPISLPAPRDIAFISAVHAQPPRSYVSLVYRPPHHVRGSVLRGLSCYVHPAIWITSSRSSLFRLAWTIPSYLLRCRHLDVSQCSKLSGMFSFCDETHT